MSRRLAACTFLLSFAAFAGDQIESDKLAWRAALSAKVEAHWFRPSIAETGQGPCSVYVLMSSTGEVLGVRLKEPCATRILERSIIAAIGRSSPLPLPVSPAAFEGRVLLSFYPKDES